MAEEPTSGPTEESSTFFFGLTKVQVAILVLFVVVSIIIIPIIAAPIPGVAVFFLVATVVAIAALLLWVFLKRPSELISLFPLLTNILPLFHCRHSIPQSI